MFILSILHDVYNKLVGVYDEDDEKDTEQDFIIKMILFGIILFLSIISAYYIPYILLVLMSMSK